MLLLMFPAVVFFCGMRQGPKMLHRLDWYRDIDLAVPYCHKPLAEADAVNSWHQSVDAPDGSFCQQPKTIRTYAGETGPKKIRSHEQHQGPARVRPMIFSHTEFSKTGAEHCQRFQSPE